MTSYLVYDVFTDDPFAGNQLAIFPDASDLPEDQLQKIASEFNFSEITFVFPPSNPENTALVRIFTQTTEIDFAGHPIIGTIIALSDIGYSSPMKLELGIGPLSCGITADGASFTTSVPIQKIGHPEPTLIAAALGLPLDAINTSNHSPIIASLGLPFVIVELNSLAFLQGCLPNIDFIREGAKAYPESDDFAIFVYVKETKRIISRMFAPLDYIMEDPATGSASATLAVLLTEIENAAQSLTFIQGEYMGRPSRINIKTTKNPIHVTVSGNAVKIMSGELISHY